MLPRRGALLFSRSSIKFHGHRGLNIANYDQIATKQKENISIELKASTLTLAMTLTLYFQGKTWNLLYLNQKWSDGPV